MKKVLFCASTLSHIRNFHLPYLKAFHDQGYEVWVAANSQEEVPYADHVVELPFCKRFFSLRNIKAIFSARKLLREQQFTALSLHTTLAAAVVRAAVLLMSRRARPKVFSICHGYLFHETDGVKKWAYLLPEKICARVTDVLMVMNHEDEQIARKHRLSRGELHFIHGMGVDLAAFAPPSEQIRQQLRERAGFSQEDYLLIYAAEFSKRKNQELLVRAFAAAAAANPHLRLLLAGDGALLEECKALAAALNLEKQVCFLGYVKGMKTLYPLCDAAVSSSKIEGLPFNILEAMACGLAVVASDIKGHAELVKQNWTGYLYPSGDEKALTQAILELYEHRLEPFGARAREAVKEYGLSVVKEEISAIYFGSPAGEEACSG